jgi:hypothetical protein
MFDALSWKRISGNLIDVELFGLAAVVAVILLIGITMTTARIHVGSNGLTLVRRATLKKRYIAATILLCLLAVLGFFLLFLIDHERKSDNLDAFIDGRQRACLAACAPPADFASCSALCACRAQALEDELTIDEVYSAAKDKARYGEGSEAYRPFADRVTAIEGRCDAPGAAAGGQ